MSRYSSEQALLSYRRCPPPRPVIVSFEKAPCPVCGALLGGRGEHGSELAGVHQHLKFKHGVKEKWRREQMLREAAE